MDFSKFKKLFYIVAIISMLLSIKSKVFGASSVTYDVNNSTETLDLSPIQNYKYYFICTYNSTTNLYYYQIITSLNGFTYYPEGAPFKNFYFSNANGNKSYDTAGSSSSLTDIQNIINNAIPRDTSNSYISYRTDYSTGNNAINLELAQYSCNFDIINQFTNEVAFKDTINVFTYPYFNNKTEIENGYPDGVIISRGDYSEDVPLYFHLLKITNTVPDGNQSTYYYQPKVFKLTKDSNYYRTYDADTENKYSYYYIKRSALTLDTDSSYLYVLSNSGDSITNSYSILQPDVTSGIYDVVESDTAGVITEQQALNDKIANMNNNQQEFQQQQQEFQNQNSILPETETNIDTNLNFSNNAPQFSSLFNGFFSRLTSTISDLGNYKDTDIITINLPIPFTNDTIPIRSDFIFSNENTNFLKNISVLLWYFIFGRYFLYFLINTYWLITSGEFFNYYLTQKEAITGDML